MVNFLLISCLSSLASYAGDISFSKSLPFSQTQCKSGALKAEVFLRLDQSRPSSESDYSGAPLLYVKGRATHLIESLSKQHPGDFSFVRPRDPSVCFKTQAYAMNDSVIAIIYSNDNRPFQSVHRVVLFDVKSDHLGEKYELGAVSEFYRIKGGFAFSTTIPRSDVDQIEMISTFKRKMSATDKDLAAIQTAKLEGFKLKTEFDPTLSFEKSPWKKYFRNREDYLNAAGWNSKKMIFENLVIYEASHFNRKESDLQESCIAMTNQRGGKLTEWRCLKEKQ